MSINNFIKKVKDKVKSKQGKKAINFIEDHKKDFERLGKQSMVEILSTIGMGDKINEDKLKIEFLNITLEQNPDMLIRGVEESGDILKLAHKRAVERAKKYNDFLKYFGKQMAKEILPFVVKLL